jgi:hypothetical protein
MGENKYHVILQGAESFYYQIRCDVLLLSNKIIHPLTCKHFQQSVGENFSLLVIQGALTWAGQAVFKKLNL